MPFAYVIEPARGCLVVRGDGALDDAAVRALTTRLAREREVAFRDALYDYRQVQSIDGLSSRAVREIAETLTCGAEQMGEKRVAIVAASDVLFGVSRMFQATTGERMPQLEVFREIEPACTFLELDPQAVASLELQPAA